MSRDSSRQTLSALNSSMSELSRCPLSLSRIPCCPCSRASTARLPVTCQLDDTPPSPVWCCSFVSGVTLLLPLASPPLLHPAGSSFLVHIMSSPSSTSNPAFTPASIASLISANLYDPRIVPTLEDYVLYQVRSSTYDFPPNRHLLSLYLSSPDLIKHDILHHLLLLSLSSFPSPHFTSIAYLIPAPLQQQEPYRHLFKLHSLLEQGHFKRFWAERDRAGEGAGAGWAAYEERYRRMIGGVVEKMYTRLSVYVLMEMWNMDRAHTEERVKQCGWRMEEDGKMIRTISSSSSGTAGGGNDKRKEKEVLSEDQLAKLLALVHTQ